MSLIDHAEHVFGAALITRVANAGIFGGSGSAIIAWLGGANAVAWAGIAIGFGGLVLNWWHKRAIQRLERERLDLEWQRLRDEIGE